MGLPPTNPNSPITKYMFGANADTIHMVAPIVDPTMITGLIPN